MRTSDSGHQWSFDSNIRKSGSSRWDANVRIGPLAGGLFFRLVDVKKGLNKRFRNLIFTGAGDCSFGDFNRKVRILGSGI
jgi:hypothetical protein